MPVPFSQIINLESTMLEACEVTVWHSCESSINQSVNQSTNVPTVVQTTLARNHFAECPQKQGCLLGTGTEDEGEERVKA